MKIKNLKIWDIIILTIIMLGPAIWTSTQALFSNAVQNEEIVFTTLQNIQSIIIQSIQLFIAFIYLWVRKFDFSKWRFKITFKYTLMGFMLFIVLGFLMDLSNLATYGTVWIFNILDESIPILSAFSEVSLSVIIFSVLNGFYEEIFFLGICTSVEEKNQNWAFIYAVFIRIAFHTYQGIISAVSIGLFLGTIYYVLYRKKTQNLYPYMFSHMIADIFGLSLIHFF